ncbi:hypothetical protein BGM26_12185 [Bacillus sp. FJAT-29790]|uniref:hypothetical protein n=1 Tax=Bacillus sp. FJAT-29790 TaxID=1895002 RepID=UPI001C23CAE8|nr:hypothetical protein [Bacillus sp. FJAT-29790]MBU8879746.1 hypothetical protein [Bacillus sp. FJAT-29790]
MNETMKEKCVRFMLIGFFILITISAFLYRHENSRLKVEANHPLALVLQTSIHTKDHPVVALYEYKNSKHLLAVYEIERTNRFKFKTLQAAELGSAPDDMSLDLSGIGLWIHINGEWLYFTNSLKEVKRNQSQRKTSPLETTFIYNEKKSVILINDKQSIPLMDGETPKGIYSLSEDGLLWLVITRQGLKIATIET